MPGLVFCSCSIIALEHFGKENVHCNEIWIYVFPEKELRGLSPNFHIYVFAIYIFPRSAHLFTPAAE